MFRPAALLALSCIFRGAGPDQPEKFNALLTEFLAGLK